MSAMVSARVDERLLKLRLGAVAQRLDGILSQAARGEPTYIDFLGALLAEETASTATPCSSRAKPPPQAKEKTGLLGPTKNH